jgi:TldD protein
MKELVLWTIEKAKQLNCRWADVRYTQEEGEIISIKNKEIEKLASYQKEGIGIRVLVGNGWGFYAVNQLNKETIEAALNKAYQIAVEADKTATAPVKLEELPPQKGTYQTPYKIDPFSISFEEKINHLRKPVEKMLQVEGVKIAKADYLAQKEKKIFAASDGSLIEQEFLKCGGGIMATAIRDGEVQFRSYPAAFDGDFSAAGWEFIESLQLEKNATQTAEEAVALLDADECPYGVMDLILGSSHLALQIHESLGHPAELDRVLGEEISLAGGSFLTTDKMNNFQYGSEIVTIVSDPTAPGGLGTYGWDDEGVPAHREPLVKNGKFVNYLSSRQSATIIGKKSTAAMRAESYNRPPIVRMTNINLEPGNMTFDEIIKTTKRGIYMEATKSWSIDDLRLNFQFGCQIAWLIENGKITKMVKNPIYSGNTPRFWKNCDAIANKDHWRLWGVMNCGKGEPMQVMQVGHGCSIARFKNIQIGVRKDG